MHATITVLLQVFNWNLAKWALNSARTLSAQKFRSVLCTSLWDLTELAWVGERKQKLSFVPCLFRVFVRLPTFPLPRCTIKTAVLKMTFRRTTTAKGSEIGLPFCSPPPRRIACCHANCTQSTIVELEGRPLIPSAPRAARTNEAPGAPKDFPPQISLQKWGRRKYESLIAISEICVFKGRPRDAIMKWPVVADATALLIRSHRCRITEKTRRSQFLAYFSFTLMNNTDGLGYQPKGGMKLQNTGGLLRDAQLYSRKTNVKSAKRDVIKDTLPLLAFSFEPVC